MIGVVVVTHGQLADEMVRVIELIVGKQERFRAVSFLPSEDMETMRERVAGAVKECEGGEGVLVFTDMFGGTPSNLSLPFHKENSVEILTGVNVPMLLKVASARLVPEDGDGKTLVEVAAAVSEYGKRQIQSASELLSRK